MDDELRALEGEERAIARLAIVLAEGSSRVTDAMVRDGLGDERAEARCIPLIAWASFTAARRFAHVVAARAGVADAREHVAAAA